MPTLTSLMITILCGHNRPLPEPMTRQSDPLPWTISFVRSPTNQIEYRKRADDKLGRGLSSFRAQNRWNRT